MKPRGKIKLALLLALAAALLLSGTAAGDFQADFTSESLDVVLTRYMSEKRLNEKNFAMGWYDFETGSEWFFNPDAFMVAGSMYKLPLNMYYAGKLASGDISPDQLAGNYPVRRAMEMSIVYSSNEAADGLLRALSMPKRDYRLLLSQYSGLDESELPEEYFLENRVSARFMINTLVCLYNNSELYSELIGYMKLAHPRRFFKKSEGEYEIAHKYGYYEGELNDCGIVYTPRPFALVVFTRKVGNSENVLSELCRLMTDYSLYLDSLPEPEPASEPEPESAAAAVLWPVRHPGRLYICSEACALASGIAALHGACACVRCDGET